MQLQRIARLPGIRAARLIEPGYDLRAVHHDSRRLDSATAFYALRGQKTDGHAFVAEAVRAGAPAVFVSDEARFADLERGSPEGLKAWFLVEDGRGRLAELARDIHGDPSRQMRLLAVTGTNGKTTTTHLAAQMLRAMGEPCAIIGSVGMWLGHACVHPGLTTPEAPDVQAFLARCLAEGVRAAAMEASSIGIATGRTLGLSFAAAAFTNLTLDHLDFHGSLEAYRSTKFHLFLESDGPAPRAVINLDDPTGAELEAALRARGRPAFTFALDGPADLTAEGVGWDSGGVSGRLRKGESSVPFRAPMLGRYNLSNLLAAAGLLLVTGSALEDVATAASHAKGAPGRLERVPTRRGFTVLVDYAHTPDALDNVLRAVRPMTAGRLWVVFGCGGERDRAKRPLMGAIAERLADRVVLTSDNPRGEAPGAILDEIARGLRDPKRARRIEDRREAIRWTLEQARRGDLVLIAGKGHETYQEIAGRRLPFRDQQIVREWAGAAKPEPSR
jgi:UDP-N-acetylmuramoyl-L-alanyl-D-glutamate--2,6-diaminopimelate ligase